MLIFFFSSRRRHTRWPRDWSSDVCSSDLELDIIAEMGFAGYFLIVQDFIVAAKKLGVYVGPGRGSAAGAVVACCTGISSIDPLRCDLLFGRFLNSERVFMPDLYVVFGVDGCCNVIDYWV